MKNNGLGVCANVHENQQEIGTSISKHQGREEEDERETMDSEWGMKPAGW
jgi:hypothetical protein